VPQPLGLEENKEHELVGSAKEFEQQGGVNKETEENEADIENQDVIGCKSEEIGKRNDVTDDKPKEIKGATPQPIGLGNHVPQTMGLGVSQVQNSDVDEFVEVHGQLVQDYIDLCSEEDLDLVARFLKLRGSPLMVGNHALTCIMQYCPSKP